MYRSLRKIRGARVVNSSGCHRYGYWNEQYLFDERPETGWCAPSRSTPQAEFLEISIPDCGDGLIAMRMLSRRINEGAGFPVNFELSGKMEDGWKTIIKADSVVNRADTWHEWEFQPTRATHLKLSVDKVEKRPEGKYFLQFMNLELYCKVN